jgi:hypothetical protein
MNAVEIVEAVSALAEKPFDRAEFPFAFLEAFGNKETTLKRLRSGASNKSDLGGVLQTNNIHIATCDPGQVTATLQALKASPATARGKAKFALATDGESFEAEDLISGRYASDLIATSTKISAFSCRWRASPLSRKSAKVPSISRRPGGSTGFISSY